jgi:hypothetical protein
MSNVSDRDDTGTVMTGVNTENTFWCPSVLVLHATHQAASCAAQQQSCIVDHRLSASPAHAQPLLPPLARRGYDFACCRGECRACTAHVDGRRVLSCMTLAAMQEQFDIDFSAAAQSRIIPRLMR